MGAAPAPRPPAFSPDLCLGEGESSSEGNSRPAAPHPPPLAPRHSPLLSLLAPTLRSPHRPRLHPSILSLLPLGTAPLSLGGCPGPWGTFTWRAPGGRKTGVGIPSAQGCARKCFTWLPRAASASSPGRILPPLPPPLEAATVMWPEAELKRHIRAPPPVRPPSCPGSSTPAPPKLRACDP